MSTAVDNPWAATRRELEVDAGTLARAIDEATRSGEPLDYRSRLLVRDGLTALRSHWGDEQFERWLGIHPAAARAHDDPAASEQDDDGFPSLKRRIVDATRPETIRQFLCELAERVARPTRLVIGGSTSLILGGDVVDVVDEVPAELREPHDMIENLTKRYGLRLAHFQLHYLPTGWEGRVRSIGVFGQLQVFVADPCDVLVGKLFSRRERDLDDLRVALPKLERETLRRWLSQTTAGFRAEPKLLDAAQRNWRILFGEDLPD
jgi:hypothetical protein